MVDAALFATKTRGKLVPPADTMNNAGGVAYKFSPEHALAQYAATGCLSDTFYANAETQLSDVISLCKAVSPEYIAKVAIYCRKKGFMKDMPALLCAYLATLKTDESRKLLELTFQEVIDNGKMLRNFVQIIRSGMLGRKSFGTHLKRLIRNWLNNISMRKLIEAYVGQTPSLADIIKMVHPKAKDSERSAFFAWCIGKEYKQDDLPRDLREFEIWKTNHDKAIYTIPHVPFQMLIANSLSSEEWANIAMKANWHTIRMNLNTFARHDVYKNENVISHIATTLAEPEVIRKVRVFPYQLFTTYLETRENIPIQIQEGLQDALDISVENIPHFDGRIAIMVDTSASMADPVTGHRKKTSVATCTDVAGLIAASLLRQNKDSVIIGFHNNAFKINLNSRDSIITNANVIKDAPNGGTNCSIAMRLLTHLEEKVDLIIYISDNESWVETVHRYNSGNGSFLQYSKGSQTMIEFENYKAKFNPNCKMVNIDLRPNMSSQTCDGKEILNIGGFSDSIFQIIDLFMKDQLTPGHWVDEINKVNLS